MNTILHRTRFGSAIYFHEHSTFVSSLETHEGKWSADVRTGNAGTRRTRPRKRKKSLMSTAGSLSWHLRYAPGGPAWFCFSWRARTQTRRLLVSRAFTKTTTASASAAHKAHFIRGLSQNVLSPPRAPFAIPPELFLFPSMHSCRILGGFDHLRLTESISLAMWLLFPL